jgi:hypothetical protein
MYLLSLDLAAPHHPPLQNRQTLYLPHRKRDGWKESIVAVLATGDGAGYGASFNSIAVLYSVPRFLPLQKEQQADDL